MYQNKFIPKAFVFAFYLLLQMVLLTPANAGGIKTWFKEKPGFGWVIVKIDNYVNYRPHIDKYGIEAYPKIDMGFVSFDMDKNQPILISAFLDYADTTVNFKVVHNLKNDDVYLIGKIKASTAGFYSFWYQEKWSVCYNKKTYVFDVKPDKYNFIGTFDILPSVSELEKAVQEGKMPDHANQYSNIPPLLDIPASGFKSAENDANLRQEANAFLSDAFGEKIETITPEAKETFFDTPTDKTGSRECGKTSKKSDYK